MYIETNNDLIAITDDRGTTLYSTDNLPTLTKLVFFNKKITGSSESGIVLNDPDNYIADSYSPYGGYYPGSHNLKSRIVGNKIFQMTGGGILTANIDDPSNPIYINMYYSDYGWSRDVVEIDNSKILTAEYYNYQYGLVLKDESTGDVLSKVSKKCTKLEQFSNHILGICSDKIMDIDVSGDSIALNDITKAFDANITTVKDIDVYGDEVVILSSKYIGDVYGDYGETVKKYDNLIQKFKIVGNNFISTAQEQVSYDINKINFVNQSLVIGYTGDNLYTYTVLNNQIIRNSINNFGAIGLETIGDKIITIKDKTIQIFSIGKSDEK